MKLHWLAFFWKDTNEGCSILNVEIRKAKLNYYYMGI